MLASTLATKRKEPLPNACQRPEDLPYLAPERICDSLEADGRADIYSLGATVYALLTGRPPFQGKSLEDTIERICRTPPAKPSKCQPSIPSSLDRAVLKMLSKRPEDRFQASTEILAELEPIAKSAGLDS
jgi:serine/threonine protein kinase